MSDDEKALIAEAVEELRNAIDSDDGYDQWMWVPSPSKVILVLDALEARVHPTVTDAEVEAGAIAAYVIDYPFRSTDGWIKTHPANRENYRTLARAALEAARAVQPTTNPKETP